MGHNLWTPEETWTKTEVWKTCNESMPFKKKILEDIWRTKTSSGGRQLWGILSIGLPGFFFFAVLTELGGNESISPISAKAGGSQDGICEKPLRGTSNWQQKRSYGVKGGSVLDFLLTPKKKVSVQVSSSKAQSHSHFLVSVTTKREHRVKTQTGIGVWPDGKYCLVVTLPIYVPVCLSTYLSFIYCLPLVPFFSKWYWFSIEAID